MNGELTQQEEADLIRDLERMRIRALTESNIEVCNQLHAGDFQLITPSGRALGKAHYLSAIASGDIKYLMWEPDSMEVRVYESVALLRYKARLEVIANGSRGRRFQCWHTDV